MPVTWSWPPPGYGPNGYVDRTDIIFAIIANSIIEKINTLTLGGASAYEVYLENTSDDPPKDVAEWLASLKGQDGQDGQDGIDGQDGQDGAPGIQGAGVVVLPVGAAVDTNLPAGTIILRYSPA